MDEQCSVRLIGGGVDEEALFTLREGKDAHLGCHYRGKLIEATADDFFDALCAVRQQLWKERLMPFCYGASLNVYPSTMGRDMGQGLKAYKMVMGRHVTMTDLVYIFAHGPDVIPASVDAQKQFWEEWLSTPRVG